MATFINTMRSHPLAQQLNSSLRAKLGLAFAIIAFLSLIVGFTALISVNVASNRLQRLVTDNEIQSDLLKQAVSRFVEARTEDISFLRVYPERGVSFATTQHVRAWERQIDAVNATLIELIELPDTNANIVFSDDEIAEVAQILDSIDLYSAKFNATTSLIQTTQTGGTSGNIAETAAALEVLVIEQDDVDLLAMLFRIRQQELNFRQTHTDDMIEAHEAAVATFRDMLGADTIDGVARAQLNVALGAYETQFTSVVNSTRLIEGNVSDYQALATTAEQILREQLANAIEKSEAGEADALRVIQQSRTLLATLSLITFVLSLFAAFVISRGINAQVNSTLKMFRQLQSGDFSARARVITPDELGQIADSVNSVLDNNAELIQTQEESAAIQQSITNLLQDITTAADGDLTTEAEVKNDITGAIADSFNFMIEQLREVIGQVRDASVQVSSSANEIQTTAEHLAEGSQQQSEQISETTSAIDEMSVSIQRVSENAAQCAIVSEQARANSDIGANAVQQTILSMGQIRGQVGRASDQLQRLRIRMREIDGVVQLINNVAERTSILAINASIQASSAGGASESFRLVASEVDDLAQRSSEATQQIARLVRQIQQRTNEATSTISATNLEVRQGIRLANMAGERLLEIEAVSDRLVELIQQISRAAKQQARGSETIAQSMSDIATVTRLNAEGTQEATASIRNLARLAEELRASVSTFKVSAEHVGAFSAD